MLNNIIVRLQLYCLRIEKLYAINDDWQMACFPFKTGLYIHTHKRIEDTVKQPDHVHTFVNGCCDMMTLYDPY